MSISLRICEAGRVGHCLDEEQRAQIEAAAASWQQAHRLRLPPLWFSGAQSQTLNAAPNFAGVVASGDVTVEIYPKLDADLLSESATPNQAQRQSVLQSLMWMLEVGRYGQWIPTGSAALVEEADTFFDLWAFLLGLHLLPELTNGISRNYLNHQGDLAAVRGRIIIGQQVARNWNRMDQVACAWDEFTPDTPLNRVLKCCLRFLLIRVNAAHARQLLERCLIFFDDVSDVTPSTALCDTRNFRYDRSTERFRRTFDLARLLLQSCGHSLSSGSADSFVFLVDMTKAFEDYVAALLEACFNTTVETQKPLGTLFDLPKGGISQLADYFWQSPDTIYIGDAKYKHLAKGHNAPLSFAEIDEEESETAQPLAGRIVSAADVRQLTVYAELAKQQGKSIELLLLYPYVGDSLKSDWATTWNDARFRLVPVRLNKQAKLTDCLPDNLVLQFQ